MPVQLIIDTDGVSDDIRAITLALQHPEAELLAVTTVHGCVPVNQATANVNRTLRANNVKREIPVYQGAPNSLLNLKKDSTVSDFFGIDGIGDKPGDFPEVLPNDFIPSSAQVAALALFNLVADNPQATIVCIGPLTNIALALRLNEKFASMPARMVIMGGNYYGVGNVHGESSAEYNFHGDPEAADVVLREMRCPITVVPWEAFFFECETQEKVDFHAHLQYETPLANYLTTATSIGRQRLEAHGRQYAYCDEIAVATAICESRVVVAAKRLVVAVELNGSLTRGQVVVDWVEQLWTKKDQEEQHQQNPLDDEKRRRIKFVTSYDVCLVDRWMHATTSGSAKFD